MKVWITRDRRWGEDLTFWAGKEPFKDGDFYDANIDDADISLEISTFEFKNCFGFTPRKGSCKQYELTLKEVK
jgi:hypothetical protein